MIGTTVITITAGRDIMVTVTFMVTGIVSIGIKLTLSQKPQQRHLLPPP